MSDAAYNSRPPFLSYERQWAPETEEGRRGCVEFEAWRAEMKAKLRVRTSTTATARE